ncbi:hypothetical protein M1N89_02135 [Dehalococcoidia bacterium]|nr:hypothetical protein [Dehalococcoidia bacterium]
MSSHYSVRNGQKYFYYKCTKVMHRNKEACPSKPLGSREFENAVIEKVKELSQDRSQLEETLQNANLVAQEELKPLRERKAILEKARKEKEEEIMPVSVKSATGLAPNRPPFRGIRPPLSGGWSSAGTSLV